MKRELKLVILLALFVPTNLFAQVSESSKTHKAQVTFAYPVGSGGMGSMEYSNNFSFNILYGLNGGVDGFELGSILNYNKGSVKGFQLSGVSNINTGSSNGFLLSGVSNICHEQTNGLLITGVLNYSGQNAKGFQLAGVSNINAGYTDGFLLSGVSNICMDSTSGVFISGVLNYSAKNAKGFQLATTNIAVSEYKGFQLGVFNYAKKLQGFQLGVINYTNNAEGGIPIGILSIVRNGHYEFEFSGGEVLFSNLNYKMGVERLYTVFKIGYSSYKSNPVYSYGIGLGGNIPLSEKQKVNIDLSSNNIVYYNTWDTDLNLLCKADFNYKYSLSDNLSLLVGPSLNVYVTREKVESEYGTLNIPYTIYTKEWMTTKLFMWAGINVGLSLKL
ncbi:MAG TPA: hypothetical protein VHO50_03385 [Bacteroidales bacterium]|nr:hypothetical protein [Bacteroidales bacterium]